MSKYIVLADRMDQFEQFIDWLRWDVTARRKFVVATPTTGPTPLYGVEADDLFVIGSFMNELTADKRRLVEVAESRLRRNR